MHIKW